MSDPNQQPEPSGNVVRPREEPQPNANTIVPGTKDLPYPPGVLPGRIPGNQEMATGKNNLKSIPPANYGKEEENKQEGHQGQPGLKKVFQQPSK